jgi:FMN phosphatase YigB (HAD superfamily)
MTVVKNTTQIKAIIFDCFKVVLKDGELAVLRQFDPNNKHEKEVKQLVHEHDLGKSLGWLYGQMGKELGVPASELKKAVETQPLIEKNEKLLNFIKNELKGKYKIGLLSDVGPGGYPEKGTTLTEDDWALFDDKVLSFAVGMAKPDPDIYKLAAKRLGVKPNECIFVDDKDYNIAGGCKVGMIGVLFDSTERAIERIKQVLSGVVQ